MIVASEGETKEFNQAAVAGWSIAGLFESSEYWVSRLYVVVASGIEEEHFSLLKPWLITIVQIGPVERRSRTSAAFVSARTIDRVVSVDGWPSTVLLPLDWHSKRRCGQSCAFHGIPDIRGMQRCKLALPRRGESSSTIGEFPV